MESEVKEEPPLEIAFKDVDEPDGDSFDAGPTYGSKKRPFPHNMDESFRLPDVTSSSIEAMHFILRQWGLEALEARFDEHLIDTNVLDYILDVDIVELCRDLPIRYRLVLRHNIKNKLHKRIIAHARQPKPKSKHPKHSIVTFTKDTPADTTGTADESNTDTKDSFTDTPASHFVAVNLEQPPEQYRSDGEPRMDTQTRKHHETFDYENTSFSKILTPNGYLSGEGNLRENLDFEVSRQISSSVDLMSGKVNEFEGQCANINQDCTMQQHDRNMMSQYLPPRLPDVSTGFTECEGYIPAVRLRQLSDVATSDYLFIKAMMEDLWPEGFAGRSVTGRVSNNASGRNGKWTGPKPPPPPAKLASQYPPKIPLEPDKVGYIHDRFLERRILLGSDRIKALPEKKQINYIIGRVIINYNNRSKHNMS